MDLIITFSGRAGGNCDCVAEHIASAGDKIVHFREIDFHPCFGCSYQCFSGDCKYRADDVYGLYDSMLSYDRVILVVPMYCGNPSSLYFIFNERCQDYFMAHEEAYGEILRRLYIMGIYGDEASDPDFVPCLAKWFRGSPYSGRVLGVQRHRYGLKMGDNVLDVPEIRAAIFDFLSS